MSNETTNLSEFDTTDGKLPSGLNVLTILTIIGSVFYLIIFLILPTYISFMRKIMDKAATSGADLTTKQVEDLQKARGSIDLMAANITPLMISGIICSILCLIGAVMMRKYRKDGFWIYLIGEIAPLIVGFILMGTAQFTGIWSYVIGIGLPLLFIILYLQQRKYLTR